jgi:hypothetical protein
VTDYYRGLVIGGPLDGQYLSHTNNVYRIPNPDGQIAYLPDGRKAMHQPNLHYTYIFLTRYWWPMQDGKPIPGLTTVLEVLEKAYHEQRRTAEVEVSQ